MGYHYYHSNLDINYFKTSTNFPSNWGCFGGIYQYYQKGQPFFVGLNVDKDIAEKFAEGFNAHFENIKMRIVYHANYLYISTSVFYTRYYHESMAEKLKETDKNVKVLNTQPFTVFTLDFNGHTDIVKYCFYPIIGELVRTVSGKYGLEIKLQEGDNYFEETFYQSAKPNNRAGNSVRIVQPFYNTPIDLETFKIFDDVERINNLLIAGKSYQGMNDYYYYCGNVTLNFMRLMAPTIVARILMRYKDGDPTNIPAKSPRYFMPKNNTPKVYYRDSKGRFISRRQALNVSASA